MEKKSFLLDEKCLSARMLGNKGVVQALRLYGSFAKFPFFICSRCLLPGLVPVANSRFYHRAMDKSVSGVYAAFSREFVDLLQVSPCVSRGSLCLMTAAL